MMLDGVLHQSYHLAANCLENLWEKVLFYLFVYVLNSAITAGVSEQYEDCNLS